MIFHVARNGEVIGEFDEEEFRSKLGRKEILWTDHFLIEGSQEWKPVHDYNPGPEPRKRMPPPAVPLVPIAAITESLKAKPKPRTPAGIGAILAIAAAFAPLVWPGFFFLISLPFLLAAFVLAIVALTKGQVAGGIVLLVGLVIALISAFGMLTDRDKILKHEPPYSNSR